MVQKMIAIYFLKIKPSEPDFKELILTFSGKVKNQIRKQKPYLKS
jgi:hypothetical protein